jgi:predicted transcriptional regulator
MNVEKLKQLKKDAGYTNKMIADESGVPLGTVQKIFSGETKAPRFKTLKAIEGIMVKKMLSYIVIK